MHIGMSCIRLLCQVLFFVFFSIFFFRTKAIRSVHTWSRVHFHRGTSAFGSEARYLVCLRQWRADNVIRMQSMMHSMQVRLACLKCAPLTAIARQWRCCGEARSVQSRAVCSGCIHETPTICWPGLSPIRIWRFFSFPTPSATPFCGSRLSRIRATACKQTLT